jgi:predicted patatin/cPLA2 family phospholipase
MLIQPSAADQAAKRSLILAGGGMRVAYQAGVLRALEEAQLAFSHVDGTSGGTMNTAMLFSGLNASQMCAHWSALPIGDFVSFLPLTDYVNPLKLKAMGDADGIVNKVFPKLGIDVAKINRSQPACQATFNVCNHSTKQNLSITNEEVRLDHLVAGISLPIFMPAVKIDGDFYTDSVWIKDANLMAAVKRGAEELWLVWCIGNSHDYKNNSFLQYVHMIELSANGALLEEYDRICELNERIARGDSPYGQTRPIKLHVIKPPYPIPLDPDLYFGRISCQELINMGYQHAHQYLHTQQAQSLPFDWRATHMQEPGTTAICRWQIKAVTEENSQDLRINIRAEAYHLDEQPQADTSSFAVFADVQLGAGERISAYSATMSFEENSQLLRFNLKFTGPTFDRLTGALNRSSLLSLAFGASAKINLKLFLAEQPVAQAQASFNLLQALGVLWKIQVKEPLSIWQSCTVKWRYFKWLFLR